MSRSLEDQHVLLTGASHGIGRELAFQLAGDGVKLSICGRDAEALDDTASRCRRSGSPHVHTGAFDLCDDAQLMQFISDAVATNGDVDILVNNAAWNQKGLVHEAPIDDFDAIVGVGLRAPFLFIRSILPRMIERRSGHIINVLSTVCHFGNERMAVYTAAKNGLEGLHSVLVKEAREHDIKVTAVYPGGTDTGFRPNKRPDYMRPESAAQAIRATLLLPPDVVVHDLTFRPMVETNF